MIAWLRMDAPPRQVAVVIDANLDAIGPVS
jgi:hypothetical protein